MIPSVREQAAPVRQDGPAVEWEECDCPLCGGQRWAPFIEAPDPLGGSLRFAVVRCRDCGLCFTNPRPSPCSIEQFYPLVYGPQRAPGPTLPSGRRLRPLARWCPPRAERRLLTASRAGRLLDFGCGGGVFLERMYRQGWEVTGLDVSAAAIHSVRTELGLPALVGTLPHPRLARESFDVITMWHSLEHVHHPREVLASAYDLLAPGGTLLAAVPNIESLPFRWFGASWYGLDLPRHLSHFGPRTLHEMVANAGFAVGTVRLLPRSSWIRASARLACRYVSPPRWQRWLRGKTASRLVAGLSAARGSADCMLVAARRP